MVSLDATKQMDKIMNMPPKFSKRKVQVYLDKWEQEALELRMNKL